MNAHLEWIVEARSGSLGNDRLWYVIEAVSATASLLEAANRLSKTIEPHLSDTRELLLVGTLPSLNVEIIGEASK